MMTAERCNDILHLRVNREMFNPSDKKFFVNKNVRAIVLS